MLLLGRWGLLGSLGLLGWLFLFGGLVKLLENNLINKQMKIARNKVSIKLLKNINIKGRIIT